MTAALTDPAGNPYTGRILTARTGHDLNEVAAQIAGDDTISASSRRTLQLMFGNRMRELWPASFRGFR